MYPDKKKCLDIIRCSSDVSNAGKVFLTYRGVILAHLHCLHNFPYALLALHVLPIGVSYWLTIIACINLIAFLRRVSCLTYRGVILAHLDCLHYFPYSHFLSHLSGSHTWLTWIACNTFNPLITFLYSHYSSHLSGCHTGRPERQRRRHQLRTQDQQSSCSCRIGD